MHVAIAALSRFTSPSGICRHAANLAQSIALRPEIEHVTFLHGEWQGYYRDLFTVESSKIQFLTVPIKNSSAARNWWFMSKLAVTTRSLRADVLHLSFPLPAPHASDYRMVVSLHDLYPYDCPEVFGFPNVYLNRVALRRSLASSDAIACVSHATLERLKIHFSAREAAKAVVIPNCVNDAESSVRRPDAWSARGFVLMVAQHRHNKNLPLALRGFAAMAKRGVVPAETALVIVGSTGPETPRIFSLIKELGIGDRVVLRESLPEAELQWFYRNCKLFLVTSRDEGFCLPLVEALRAGCRVLSSGLPVLREIGGESCVYFDPGTTNPEDVADAAVQALEGALRPAPDLRRFSFEAAGQSYVKLYETLTGNSVRSPREYASATPNV